ncbi:hypothetical protein HYH03_004407 [Edaphochlamys debaryana]|uniref:5'-3' exonuclease domain-containing protein n=1 Tax=Edaphochlamys debaryana TaxID=47281 RepID=A0A836C3C4_9CHLO|nr:hypothetical protein HYH03_004407 [Edaphochlamys debaryana]|eukprot:KAG2497668.1 hypothetical protein HYH03_004407 [Edaphochlamys debaryana]
MTTSSAAAGSGRRRGTSRREVAAAAAAASSDGANADPGPASSQEAGGQAPPPAPSRRGRRPAGSARPPASAAPLSAADSEALAAIEIAAAASAAADAAPAALKRRGRKPASAAADPAAADGGAAGGEPAAVKPRRTRAKKAATPEVGASDASVSSSSASSASGSSGTGPSPTPSRARRPAATAPAAVSPPPSSAASAAAAVRAAATAPAATTSAANRSSRTSGNGSNGMLLVVDGNYLANRSYFGYGSRKLTTREGVPTTVTYGVIKTLQQALRELQPTALAVVFDSRGPTFRSALSFTDPAAGGPVAAAAARLWAEGRLDWQDLATRLLALPAIRSDLAAAATAQQAATPASFLSPGGTFLPSSPSTSPSAAASADPAPGGAADAAVAAAAALTAGYTSASGPAAPGLRGVDSAAAALAALTAAAGPELAAALRLPGTEAEGAVPTAAVRVPYKAGRLAKPEDWYPDFLNLQRLLGLMGVTPLSRPWLEADDLAGMLTRLAVSQGTPVRLLSGDRDLMQLVSDEADVALLYPRGGGGGGAAAGRRSGSSFAFELVDEAGVAAALGVGPQRAAQFRALTGDSSDCLPGVAGVGPKTAVQWLDAYGSLAGLAEAEAAGLITGRKRELLRASWPAAHYTLAMARVLGAEGAPALDPSDALPSSLLPRLTLSGFDAAAVAPALEALEMRSLLTGTAAGGGGDLWRDFGGGR